MSLTVSDRLLDATIQCLAEQGFAATTTRRVAEAAGVSQGALQHYFPNKDALVQAAMHRLIEQLATEATGLDIDPNDERACAEAVFDTIWAIHNLPITPAVLEVMTAARTDPNLAASTSAMTNLGMKTTLALAREALPSYAAKPGFDDLIAMAVAAARGTVLAAEIPGVDPSYVQWPAMRERLLASLDAL